MAGVTIPRAGTDGGFGPAFEEELDAARRYIIKRPRLTRLLDDSKASILMLVAPAGYGKTTLAREWLEDKKHAWYQATIASSDVAALAAGLAQAVSPLVPGAGAELQKRLRAIPAPEVEAEALGRSLAEGLKNWPSSAALVIDDYQHVMSSPAAESFVAALANHAPLLLLIATRRRPTWAVARRILYGEIQEFGRTQLAMNPEEAGRVLSQSRQTALPGLVALAEGWPAVIALAARTTTAGIPEDDVPATLYEYLAQELYQGAGGTLRHDLRVLALAPRLTRGAACALIGDAAAEVLSEAVRLGFAAPASHDEFHIQPLLRSFLTSNEQTGETASVEAECRRLTAYYCNEGSWDEAFETAMVAQTPELVTEVVERALGDLANRGRVQTLKSWAERARKRGVRRPVITLTDAEIAYRHGQIHEAFELATEAIGGFCRAHSLYTRALLLAGSCAYRAGRLHDALNLYERADAAAVGPDDKWRALYGLFITTMSLEENRGQELLERLLAFESNAPEFALRRAMAPSLLGVRFGTVVGTLTPLEEGAHSLDRASDPLVRTAFMNCYAHRLVLAGRYDDAFKLSSLQLDEAKTYGIRFGMAVGLSTKAAAEIGRRHYRIAGALIESSDRIAATLAEGTQVAMNLAILRARLALAQQRPANALAALAHRWERLPEPSMVGEHLAAQALAHACMGNAGLAVRLAEEAAGATRGVEARVLAEGALCVLAHQTGVKDKAAAASARLLAVAVETGAVDSFVTAYRAYPQLLEHLQDCRLDRPTVAAIMLLAHDRKLAIMLELLVEEPAGASLTRRELEIYDLLCQGLSNKEIARFLFISESTVKLHIHHVFQKLGVRSRAQAIAKRLE